MYDLKCYVHVEFPDDPNVEGILYWYECPFEGAEIGDEVIAPLGRHNHKQKGVIREVRMDYEYNAPFPIYLLKCIKKLIKK